MDNSPPNESDKPATKRICDRCVGENYLKGLIRSEGIDDSKMSQMPAILRNAN
jgi:hypothetical protein